MPFWLKLVIYSGSALWLALLVLVPLARGAVALAGRRPRRFWKPALKLWAATAPLCLLLAAPLFLGIFAGRFAQTRGDESRYAGPRIDATGLWIEQSRKTLREEGPPPADAPRNPFAVEMRAADGVPLRGFLVPASGVPRARVALAHGLFRGGLELEDPGRMLHDLGCEVLLLELRNHGGSGRARLTFGRDEALDVIAAAGFLRARDAAAKLPLVIFGVSLGAGAASLAAPRLVPPPEALVLDSPIDDLAKIVDRMLGERVRMPQPFRALTEASLGCFSGVAVRDVRPAAALRALSPASRALVIGGGKDELVPVSAAEAVFGELPLPADRKELWIVPDATHGKSWEVDPEGYRLHLARLLDAIAPGPAAGG